MFPPLPNRLGQRTSRVNRHAVKRAPVERAEMGPVAGDENLAAMMDRGCEYRKVFFG